MRALGPCKTLVLHNGSEGGTDIGTVYTYSLPEEYCMPPPPLRVLEGTRWESNLIVDCRSQLEDLGFIKVPIPGVDCLF